MCRRVIIFHIYFIFPEDRGQKMHILTDIDEIFYQSTKGISFYLKKRIRMIHNFNVNVR